MVTRLAEAINSFDGRHVDGLRSAAASFQAAEADDLNALLLSEVSSERAAASWIMRELAKTGRSEFVDWPQAFSVLKHETDWEVLLHLLQSVQLVPEMAMEAHADIERLMSSPKALVAAWALDAYVRLALVGAGDLDVAKQHVQDALNASKASQRARARNLASLVGL